MAIVLHQLQQVFPAANNKVKTTADFVFQRSNRGSRRRVVGVGIEQGFHGNRGRLIAFDNVRLKLHQVKLLAANLRCLLLKLGEFCLVLGPLAGDRLIPVSNVFF